MYPVITLCLLAAVVGLTLLFRKAQTELHLVADHAPSAIAHVVGDGENLKYRFVNQKYAALYGRRPSDVIGKHPKDVLGPDVFARSHANMCRAIAGQTITFDLDLAGGTVEVVYNPDVAHPGRARGFVGVITDVSELRALQRQMKHGRE